MGFVFIPLHAFTAFSFANFIVSSPSVPFTSMRLTRRWIKNDCARALQRT